MKEAFKLIKEMLEEESKFAVSLLNGKTDRYVAGVCDTNKKAIQIVSEVEAEYGNGWIQCSERLPHEGQKVLACVNPSIAKHEIILAPYESYCNSWHDGTLIAWMPLPSQYTPTTD